MRHPVNRELFAYWDALRAGRSAPERSAIDPAAIRNLLAYTFLLEVGECVAGSRAVSFRLSGTRLNALFRRDLKGGAFSAVWAEGDEREALVLVDGVLDDCAPVVAGVRGGPKDYQPTDFELMLLPLRHHGRTHARLLGSIVPKSTPSWIGLRPIEGLRLAAFRTVRAHDAGRIGTFGIAARSREGAGSPGPAFPTSPSPVEARAGLFRVYQGGRVTAAPATTGAAADLG